jgi:hypothetical protein
MERVMTYSGNNKKPVLLFALLTVFVFAAKPQTQVPMEMIEAMIYPYFSYVPAEEFDKVFKTFVRDRYSGRKYLYEREVESFTSSFSLYVRTTGAFNKYSPSDKPKTATDSKPQFPATHRLTGDLKLFVDQDGGSKVIATLKKGTGVQVIEYGGYADMDGITAKWAQVKTSGGETGWLFSGYLEDAPK